MDLVKKILAATAILGLLGAAVTFTQVFVTHTAMAEEIQQVYLKMDLRDLNQRKDALADREMDLQILMIKDPASKDVIQVKLNETQAEQERVNEQIRGLLQGDQ